MVVGGILEMFVLKHYHNYRVLPYVVEVYGRCIVVVLISSIVPAAIYARYMEPCFLRMILTGILTTFSVSISALFLGMSRADRIRVCDLVISKLKSMLVRKA